MAIIPTYTSKEPGAVAAPSVSKVGAAAIGEVDKLSVHFQKRQQEDDVIGVMNADMALSEWQDDYQYNQETGVLVSEKFKGLGAKGAYKKYGSDAEIKYNEILGTLENQNQKDLFARSYQSMLDSGRDRFAKHEAGETDKYRKGSLEGFSTKQAKDAITRYRENDIAGSTAAMNSAVATKLQSMGAASQPEKDNAALAVRTAIHKEIFDGLIAANDPTGAQGYLKDNKKNIDPTIYDDLQAKGKVTGDKAKGNEIYGKIYDADASLETMYSKIEKAGGTAEQQAIAKTLVKDRRSVANADESADKRAKDQAEEDATDFGSSLIRSGQHYNDLDPTLLDSMGRVGRAAVLKEYKSIADGVKPSYNYGVEDKLNAMFIKSLTGEDSSFLTHNMAQYNASHDRGRMEYWKGRKAAMNSSDAKEVAKNSKRKPHYINSAKLIANAVKARFSDAGKRTKLAGQYTEQIIGHIDEWHDANPGKVMDPKELNRTIYSYMVEGEYDDGDASLGDPNATYSQALTAGYGGEFYADEDKSQFDLISKATGVPIGSVDAAFKEIERRNKAIRAVPGYDKQALLPASLNNLKAAYQAIK